MQTSVALSSMDAEYMAASAATQEAMWQARLLEQMGMRVDLPIKLYEGNKSAIMFADHPGDHRNTKHIDTRKEFDRWMNNVLILNIALIFHLKRLHGNKVV